MCRRAAPGEQEPQKPLTKAELLLARHLLTHLFHDPRPRYPEAFHQAVHLAQSGSGVVLRNGFAQMINEVALGQVGILICLEASRVARNNAEWYRLLDLCAVTDTLIGDRDGIYHPGLFNHRLLLGLKGTLAEAELHVLRMRLNGAIRNKAKRGELRRGLPVGLVWGEGEGQVIFHPDQAVTGAIRTIFEKYAELGSARQVWLWFESQGLLVPHQCRNGQILWIKPRKVRPCCKGWRRAAAVVAAC